MNVLVFNCGSSSLKYRLLAMPSEQELAGGEAQRVGPKTAEPARIVHRQDGRETIVVVEMASHSVAFERILDVLRQNGNMAVDAIGHRVVHGGALFNDSALVTDSVLAGLLSIQDMAPIHNPPATALIQSVKQRYPALPQVAVFDTAFHATIPEYARTYALPAEISRTLGIRKYGFHGTSHQYVAEEAARYLGKPLDHLNAVSCHLGSGGASLCAIVGGRSVDNTFGYSPLQGLVMSTRCGDLDPALTLNLMIDAGGDTAAVEKMLNKNSGVLGLSGFSGDIRDVLQGRSEKGCGVARSRTALTAQVYLWRIRKYLGAYLAVVGRTDAIIFTDTIGELVPAVRGAVCAALDMFGVQLDETKNNAVSCYPCDVATVQSPVRILVIQTNEELAIARQTYVALQNHAAVCVEKEGVLQ